MSGETKTLGAARRQLDPARAFHAYGGVEHRRPVPTEGCLLCELDASEKARSEMAGFIGHKGLGEEFTDWALAQRAEVDRLLADES